MIMTIDNNNNKVTIPFDLCMLLLCKCMSSKLHTQCNSSRSMVSPQLPWLPGFQECDCVSRQSRAFAMVTLSPLYITIAMVTTMHIHTPVTIVKTFHGFDKAWIVSVVTDCLCWFQWSSA
jgi:hypothetical protein